MASPAKVTVEGVIANTDGPVAGTISFTRDTAFYPTDPTDGNMLIPEVVLATTTGDGVLSVDLWSNNDPNTSPSGWTWHVQPRFPGWRAPFDLFIPYDVVSPVKLAHLAPVPPDEDGALYSLANHTHAGGGGGGTDITADQISDSGATGRALVRSATAGAARTVIGLGGAAILDVGVGSGNVAAGNQAATLLAAHTAASDPHPVYLTAAEGNAAYDATGAATSALAAATAADANHVAAADPHANYTSIYYWNGSSYSIVTGANVYVGGTGPASPTNGDVVFPS